MKNEKTKHRVMNKKTGRYKLRRKKCKECNEYFQPKKSTSIFCSVKCSKKGKKQTSGRKWFDGKDINDVISKCQEVWAVGGTDAEASMYANITSASLSRFLQVNPEIAELRDRLQEKPILLARRSVMSQMRHDGNLALKYLERKKNKEFSVKQEIEQKDVPTINITLGEHGEKSKK